MILQVEGQTALSNLDEILSVDGFDILFIDLYDLSQASGFLGEITHPGVVNQMKIIVDKARKANKIVGIFTDTTAQVKLFPLQAPRTCFL